VSSVATNQACVDVEQIFVPYLGMILLKKMCEVASFKNFENSLTTAKVMTKTKVAPLHLGHGVDPMRLLEYNTYECFCN